jgi:hypothetical protein
MAAKAAFKAFKLAKSDRGHGSFEPLIPVGLEDGRFMRYEQELLKALRNDDVLNIALTGGYGAGKSSVLKTFFDRHSEFPHALISLATFSKNDPVPALSPPGARELTPASEISNPDNRENADASRSIGSKRPSSNSCCTRCRLKSCQRRGLSGSLSPPCGRSPYRSAGFRHCPSVS